MSLDREDLIAAIERLKDEMDNNFDLLNTADGALGDGDLGVTMTRGMHAIYEMRESLPNDLGMLLFQCAQAFTKTSGSSYGTLLATGLMAAAKLLKGQTTLNPNNLAELIATSRDKMQERGKAELGGKTVLDSLDYLSKAVANSDDKSLAASQAVDAALNDFRDKPATIGRARIFGDKSVGMDDPGMLAMSLIVHAVARR